MQRLALGLVVAFAASALAGAYTGVFTAWNTARSTRIGTSAQAERSSLSFEVRGPATATRAEVLFWKMGAEFTPGTWTLHATFAGGDFTDVVTLTPNSWNRWEPSQPLVFPATVVLEPVGSAEMDFVWVPAFPIYDGTLESTVSSDVGMVTMVVVTDAVDERAVRAGCSDTRDSHGWPYDSDEVVQLQAGQSVDQVIETVPAPFSIGQVGVPPDGWPAPVPADLWLTLSQGPLSVSTRNDQQAFFPGAGLPIAFTPDASTPFVLSVAARTGSARVLRLVASRSDAGVCDPVIRATWGGAQSYSGQLGSDLSFGYVSCVPLTLYPDLDHDGFGGAATSVCYPAAYDYLSTTGDCDDSDARAHPDAGEICDGIDDDCDGLIDRDDPGLDLPACELQRGVCRGARHGAATCQGGWLACDAADYGTSYELVELSCDGLDNDCDGETDELDGGPPCSSQLGVCSGTQSRCVAGQWTECGSSEYGPTWQTAESTCDGLDNDCNGLVDDIALAAACPNQLGVCGGSHASQCVNAAWVECTSADYPPTFEATEETCDGLDNDCDGATDGDDPQLAVVACALTQGVCRDSFHARVDCRRDGWAACEDAAYGPKYERLEVSCDGFDNDCDGQTDEGCPPAGCSTGTSVMTVLAMLFGRRRRRG